MTSTAARKGLNPRTIAALVDARQPGLWSHRKGLHLHISAAGTPNWCFRYTIKGGRRRLMMLEAVNDVSAPVLAIMEARAAALKAQVKAGYDPMAERDGQRKTPETARQQHDTFEEAARRFVEEQKPNWKSVKHGDQWLATLQTYAFPIIGKKAPHEITTSNVLDVLRQPYGETTLWNGARETASRVRMRIEAVLSAEYAEKHDNPAHRDAWQGFSNPARWKQHLERIFKASSKRAKQHFKAMAYQDVPAFVAELEKKPDFSAHALMLTILCATRTNETLQATWDEIDLEAGTWTIPAERMKAGKEHVVPLSSAAIALLETLPRIEGNPYLFPGAREGKPLSNMSMLMMVRGMREGENYTVHGFRSAFRDWSGEETLHPDIIAEMALAHTIKDATVKAYRRGNALERRKQLMEQWADYLFLEKLEYSEKWQKYIP